MAEDSRRYISRRGVTEGPFTVDELYEMAAAKQIDFQSFFWSESKQAWKPMAGIMIDIDPEQLDSFIAAGVKQVRVLGSGKQDCHACSLLTNRIFAISSPPPLPPSKCRCVPWCRLVLTAVREVVTPPGG